MRLLYKRITTPLRVASNGFDWSSHFLSCFPLCLPAYQIVVSRKIAQGLAFEIRNSPKPMLLHKRQQTFLHRLDGLVPKFHNACADLDRVSSEKNELCGILTGFNPSHP